METRARFLGHPVHPMLVVLPLGLLVTSPGLDVVHVATQEGRWAEMAFWTLVIGVAGGVVAAVFGVVDWLGVPRGTRAWSVGLYHGSANALVLALFAGSAVLRWPAPEAPPVLAVVLSFTALVLAAIAGWLGGELVYRLGVGVDARAHRDASSSLARDLQP